jgi:hypothetical protein
MVQIPVAAFIQIAKIAMKMMVAIRMVVMAVKKGTIIALAMKWGVAIPTQIGILMAGRIQVTRNGSSTPGMNARRRSGRSSNTGIIIVSAVLALIA